jgi:dicarboxylate transporter 10
MQTLAGSGDSKRPSTLTVIRTSIHRTGVQSLYAGLTAALMRQMSYSLVRLGSYERLKEYISKGKKPTTPQSLLAASLAGGLGGIAGNPAGTSSRHTLHRVS